MPKVHIKSRVIPEPVRLGRLQFIRFVSQRSGTSQQALHQAMKILADGIKQALAEGYEVIWDGVCVFNVREVKERTRFNPQTHVKVMQAATCRVHIRASASLTRDMLRKSAERVAKFSKEHPVKDVVKK